MWVVKFGLLMRKGSRFYRWALRHLKPRLPKRFVPLEGCDYVSCPPAAVAAAGKKFVCRYLSTPGNPKNLTVTEAKALHANGISIVLVFEATGKEPMGGAAQGIKDAKSARSQALLLGCPATVPIYFAVDFNPIGTQMNTVVAYIKGAATVLGPDKVGVYGGYPTVNACVNFNACKWFWQTYAWSGTPTKWHRKAQIHQYSNAKIIGSSHVDLDRAMKREYGQWDA